MDKLQNSLAASRFSHIYYEKKALGYHLADEIIKRFDNARMVEIDHYKDVFCRPGQDYQLQKKAQKLILAVKTDNLIYKGPDICQNFGFESFYYTSTLLNCVYNCDYCYLQGMYPSAHIVAFVNLQDFFDAVSARAAGGSLYLTVSYDTDLLAFEKVIPYASRWIEFASAHRGIILELRTKSANYNAIAGIKPPGNVILAWTLSPEEVIQKYEKLTPSLDSRLAAIKKAISDGWKMRLCFDPVINIENFNKVYTEFIDRVFADVPRGGIYDVGIGAFRMSSGYLKRIRKTRTDSDLVHYPFECRNGIAGYPTGTEKELLDTVKRQVLKYMDEDRIYLP